MAGFNSFSQEAEMDPQASVFPTETRSSSLAPCSAVKVLDLKRTFLAASFRVVGLRTFLASFKVLGLRGTFFCHFLYGFGFEEDVSCCFF